MKKLPLSIHLVLSIILFSIGHLEASKVEIKKSDTGWELQVDGQPFWIKGVGLNEPEDKTMSDTYLQMASDMGANSIRTWGGASKEYLDKAHAKGLMVNVGFWVNPVRVKGGDVSYLSTTYKKQVKEEALAYVKLLKDHPALLMWNIGNEILGFTEDVKEREALGLFLEDLYQAIHKLDPNHPILFASASTRDLPYLKKWVPSVDVIGINAHGGLGSGVAWLKTNGWDKPLIATEIGPIGAWDLRNDRNGKPWEPQDHMKAEQMRTLWKHVDHERAYYLGGYAFVLGDFRNQDSLSWLNMNFKDEKRDSYWTMYEVFTGKKRPRPSPRIYSIQLNEDHGLNAGKKIQMSFAVTAPDLKALRYEYFMSTIASDPLIVEKATLYSVSVKEIALVKNLPATKPAFNKSVEVTLPTDISPGVYRIYVKATDTGKDAGKTTAVLSRTVQIIR